MKEIEVLDRFFNFLYKNSVCEHIERVVIEECDETVTSKDLRRIFELIYASGLVEELNYIRGGSHRAIKLNEKGYQVMLKYGSYMKYLGAMEKPGKLDESVKKSEIWSNYGNLMIGILSFIGGAILSEPLKQLWQILQSFFR